MELKGLIGKRRNKEEERRKEGIRTRQGFGHLTWVLTTITIGHNTNNRVSYYCKQCEIECHFFRQNVFQTFC